MVPPWVVTDTDGELVPSPQSMLCAHESSSPGSVNLNEMVYVVLSEIPVGALRTVTVGATSRTVTGAVYSVTPPSLSRNCARAVRSASLGAAHVKEPVMATDW